MNSQRRNVAIVGVGLIGRAWAAIFARAGWNVRLTDPHVPTLKAAPRLIRDELQALARHGLAQDPDGTVARVSIAASLEDALTGVEFVQENGPERVEEKQTIFAQLDRLAPPDALLVSSTSAITASRFTETLPGRARCLVGHPVNPPHLVPLVELCGAPWTAPESIERARTIYREIGQVPVTINREINGFVLNRLQGALLAEAFRLVGEGYISAEDLDHNRQGRPRVALVVSRAVRNHRTQCARRHSGLLRALHRILQGTGGFRGGSRSLSKPECRPRDRGMAAPADAGAYR